MIGAASELVLLQLLVLVVVAVSELMPELAAASVQMALVVLAVVQMAALAPDLALVSDSMLLADLVPLVLVLLLTLGLLVVVDGALLAEHLLAAG